MDFFLFRISPDHFSVIRNTIDPRCDHAVYMTKYSGFQGLVLYGLYCITLTITFFFFVLEAKTFWANALE